MSESVQLIVTKIEELIIATGGKIQAYYPYVVKQQIIGAVANLIALLLSIGLVFLGIGLVRRVDDWSGPQVKSVIALLLSVFGIFLLSLTLVQFSTEGIGQLLNPHYFAVQDILKMGSDLIK